MRFKRIAAIFAAISGMGIWQISQWVYDNPIWIAIELKFKLCGVIALVIGAMIINFTPLFYYRNKRVNWLCWDKGVDLIKNSSRSFIRGLLFVGVLIEVVFFTSLFSVCLIALAIIAAREAHKILICGLKISWMEDVIMFFLLSIFQDSFITTAYLRHGRKEGLGGRDYIIFFSSSIVSIGYWALRNGIIAETLRFLLKG